ncbi:hypothetical protein [uncultured Sulfitobacter sp.]|uniref:hypothetical protein n=1 Tax=uncultured Sulfitobacter sp. TaxID=191468 RepID=UPI0030D8D2E4|tara:strand:+ start:24773 stop:26548 length:1776 start_codon:yes stop_codon:yes gene_type:complete
MMRKINIVLAFFLLLAPPVWGQEEDVFAPLTLVDFGQRDLLEARRSLLLEMVAPDQQGDAAPSTEAHTRVYLDLAELHLAKMMRFEAEDYLAAVDVETASPEAQRRYRTLQLALDLLSERAALGQAVSRSVGWTQGQALRTAAFARLGEDDEAARLLPVTIEALSALSPAMTAAILPDLFEAAIAAENWEVAEALAARFPDHAELRDAAAYRFLLARTSEISGDLLMAYDGYAHAAGGRDAYAHRARLAIVQMGRRTDTLPLEDAVALLKTARWAWSGDVFAKEGVALLADYTLELGDYQTALWALGQLLTEAESPKEAEAVRERAREAIESYYQAGAAGDLNLAEFISGHAAIMAGWRYDSGFVESAVALPQTLLSSGMTALAAREFRNLRTIAEAAEELELFTPDPELITHLFRDEAGALLAGGQADAAVDLLGGLAPGQGDDVETERLLIQALSQAGRSDELADWRGRALDIDSRRSRAVALYETRKWAAARQALLELWDAYPAQFSFSDATRLTLAAYELGDGVTVSRAMTAFPSLTDLPGWTEIAMRLETQGPPPTDLNTDTIRSSVDSANRVLDAVNEVSDTMYK